jgi:4-amino-4-deoxy-L-arabinose transferase-like glycosyltransferase
VNKVNAVKSVIVIVVGLTLARFFWIEHSPPGFYSDEAAIASQIICLRQSGHDLHGAPWPMFSNVLGGGYATPPMLYLGAVWTGAFGDSVGSFRSFAAFFGALFVVSSFFFGLRLWRSTEAAWLSALAAAISPWAFHFSRIGWDPALAPALLAGAYACLFAGGPRAMLWAALGGLLAALAAYAYPPMRVQIALVTPVAFLLGRTRNTDFMRRQAVVFLICAVLASLPLLALTASGEIQGRFLALSVFNPDILISRGYASEWGGLTIFAKNLLLHFSPRYLLWSGDTNLRHSTQSSGEWSPLDTIAVGLVLFALMRYLFFRRKPAVLNWTLAFVVLGYIAGLVPAALTWEGNPHALRAIGAVAFLSVFSGGVLATIWDVSRWSRIAIVAAAAGFSVYFLSAYFQSYPARSLEWFDGPVHSQARQSEDPHQMNLLEAAHRDHPSLAFTYYRLAKGFIRCQ